MEIRLLAEETISRIAAGEVIERPINVVKELVENSIDAGATAITVEIREGGISLIRVTDNGCGIERDQISRAFVRHATSKIRSADDLSSLSSLGFRGEALASIAAVAQVEMITRVRGALSGTRAVNDHLAAYSPDAPVSIDLEEIGAPDGTTVIVRNLFGSIPVRRRFLRQPQTEAGYITDLIEKQALSHPEISFHYRVNGQDKLHTTGNGNLRELIYRIYGRETAAAVVPIHAEDKERGMRIEGFLGRPEISRSSRSFETFFINGRMLRSKELSAGLEEGYRTDLMQHRFPFAVLHIFLPPGDMDVNVHPSKMEVRFTDRMAVIRFLDHSVHETLRQIELIPKAALDTAREEREARKKEALRQKEALKSEPRLEAFETGRAPVSPVSRQNIIHDLQEAERQEEKERLKTEKKEAAEEGTGSTKTGEDDGDFFFDDRRKTADERDIRSEKERKSVPDPGNPFGEVSAVMYGSEKEIQSGTDLVCDGKGNQRVLPDILIHDLEKDGEIKDEESTSAGREDSFRRDTSNEAFKDSRKDGSNDSISGTKRRFDHFSQINLFGQQDGIPTGSLVDQEVFVDSNEKADEPILTREKTELFRYVGQIFNTYWLIEYEGRLLIIDQHAAHEKVNYERMMKRLEESRSACIASQQLLPPIVLRLSGREEAAYQQYEDVFASMGYEIEEFGAGSYAIRAVPTELFGRSADSLLREILEEIMNERISGTPHVITAKIASMSCKAAVKGNSRLSEAEARALIAELLSLDNPYHCPHGRPTMVVMSRQEMDRKFGRIV